MRVGADHLDLEAGHAALADLVERVRDAVHRADRRRPRARPGAARRRGARACASRGRGRPRRARRGSPATHAVKSVRRRRVEARRRRGDRRAATAAREPALVAAPRAALEPGVREPVGLEEGEQVAFAQPQVDGVEPRAQQGAAVLGTEVAADGAGAGVALRHHALDHPQDRARVRGRRSSRRGRASARRGPSRRAPTWRPSPARRARSTRPGADVGEELARLPARRASRDQVRPMSTPAWSSDPPTPTPPWVST